MVKVAIQIASKDRPSEIQMCLSSILAQNFRDISVYLAIPKISDKNLPNLKFWKKAFKFLDIPFYLVDGDKSIVEARRNMTNMISEEKYIFVMDDDNVLTHNYLSVLYNFLEENKKAVAVSGLIHIPYNTHYNQWREKREGYLNKAKIYNRIIVKNKKLQWGEKAQVLPYKGRTVVKCQMLVNSFLYRSFLVKYGYVDYDLYFKKGGGRGEEIDFTLQLSRFGYLYYIPYVTMFHFRSEKGRKKETSNFKKEILDNYKYLCRKHRLGDISEIVRN